MLGSTITIQNSDLPDRITSYIRDHLDTALSVETLCHEFHISKNTLYTIFRENHNCTVNKFIVQMRITNACRLLTDTEYSIARISEEIGMENYTYFCKVFKKRMGVTPGTFREQAQKNGQVV
jgi:YesN/AraC family two-component response regulator